MWQIFLSGSRVILLLASVVVVGLLSFRPVYAQKDTLLVGYLEYVHINGNVMEFDAKIDTGADNSSLHVKKYKYFKKNGKRWVRFTIIDMKGKQEILERQMLRYSYVKRKMLPPEKRPVVKMFICLANVAKKVNVSLVDRTGYRVPVLIGRSFLKGDFVVDPARKYQTKPLCKKGV